MAASSTKAFKSGNSIAVRLPKEIAFEEGTDLIVERSGDVMTIYPAKKRNMADLIEELRSMPRPPYVEERDTEELPEPKGL